MALTADPPADPTAVAQWLAQLLPADGTDIADEESLVALLTRLARQASHDTLTGLPNRVLLLDRLEHALARSTRDVTDCAVLFVDVDNFKVINDSLGHGVGDALLVEVSAVLQQCCRASDTLGRLGGDEFLVICEDTTVEQAVALADRIATALRRPIPHGERQFVISTSIGIASASAADTDPETLLREADAALYVAKEGGRARHAVFTDDTHARAMRRVELEEQLRRAIGGDEFHGLRVAFQPQVDLPSGRVVGMEALLRWEPPGQEAIEPAEFIPVAEETGLIIDLGAWVLDQACAVLAGLQRRTGRGPRSVTVNVSVSQVVQVGFVQQVLDTLDRWRLEPSRLCLELTEGALKHGGGAVLPALEELEAAGVYLSIDDFGTGYSSLSRLRDLPFEVVKIDRRFIDGLGNDPADTAIVSSIMSLAHAMGLHVIAEGVETAAQACHLVRLGCRVGQGFLFSPAVPPEELWVLSRDQHRLWSRVPLEAASDQAPTAARTSDRDPARGRVRLIDEFMFQLGAPGTEP